MSVTVRVLLLSTYELGRQPFGLASPAAWLREAGFEVTCLDLAKVPLGAEAVRGAALVALHLPMHTATRLALPIVERIGREHPSAHVCCYGLYAPLNAALLRSFGVGTVLGGEFEAALVDVARRLEAGAPAGPPAPEGVPRLVFRVPDRSDLPPLTRYASLETGGGERRVAGYTEASRGCKHRCRHCPVVPVYGGRFRVVAPDVVMADVRAQVAAGARHITFGDPDFLNGPRHALEVARAFGREFAGVTYDVTIKVEHLLAHADLLPVLGETGCVLVTSAVESVDDRVLAILEKGHTREDVARAVAACRAAGLALAPTFVPFTPWTTREGYVDLLESIAALDLVDAVAPIQLAIRLLVPDGSRLLELAEVRQLVGPFDPKTLAYPWWHTDPEVDRLQAAIIDLVGRRPGASRAELFARVREMAYASAGWPAPRAATAAARPRTAVPYLNEPWYC